MLVTQTQDFFLEQIIPRKGKLQKEGPVVWGLCQCNPFHPHRPLQSLFCGQGYWLGTFCAEVHSVWTSNPKAFCFSSHPNQSAAFLWHHLSGFQRNPSPFFSIHRHELLRWLSPYRTRFTPAFCSFLSVCRAHPTAACLAVSQEPAEKALMSFISCICTSQLCCVCHLRCLLVQHKQDKSEREQRCWLQ